MKYFENIISNAQHRTYLAVIILLFVTFITLSCNRPYGDASRRRINDEKIASGILNEARQALAENRYDDAEKSVKSLRDTCPHALEGREQGILLLDSIALRRAETDTTAPDRNTRIDFYRRKLAHDLRQRETHQ